MPSALKLIWLAGGVPVIVREPQRETSMSEYRRIDRRIDPSRRDVVGGLAGATIVAGAGIGSRTVHAEPAMPSKGLHKIDRNLLIAPDQAFEWNLFKAEG